MCVLVNALSYRLMMTCLLNITGLKGKSKNGTDIKQLTDESRKVVENLNKTIRLV